MTNKKDKEKHMQDKLQIILSDLLKDDDNKYCVDCDAKSPRWASWSLGVFLCIRCAGIHRNLGVHLSRVKSVNLDSWTPQQVAMMKEIGNSRGRAIYEANVEDSFRRPQNDSALDQFIRAKYEHKRYIAKEWIPPKPSDDSIAEDIRRLDQNQHKKRITPLQQSGGLGLPRKEGLEKPMGIKKPETGDSTKSQNGANKVDLLGLGNDANVNNEGGSTQFGDFVFAAAASSPSVNGATGGVSSSSGVSSASADLMGLSLGPAQSSCANVGSSMPGVQAPSTAPKSGFCKDSILALYGNTGASGTSAGVSGGWTTPTTSSVGWTNPPTSSGGWTNPPTSSGGNNVGWSTAQAAPQSWQAAPQGFGVQHNPFMAAGQQQTSFQQQQQQPPPPQYHQLQQQGIFSNPPMATPGSQAATAAARQQSNQILW